MQVARPAQQGNRLWLLAAAPWRGGTGVNPRLAAHAEEWLLVARAEPPPQLHALCKGLTGRPAEVRVRVCCGWRAQATVRIAVGAQPSRALAVYRARRSQTHWLPALLAAAPAAWPRRVPADRGRAHTHSLSLSLSVYAPQSCRQLPAARQSA